MTTISGANISYSRSMKRGVHKTTHIAGYDADHVSVRGKDLVTELMGRVTFSEMIFLHLTGALPSRRQATLLDAVLVTIMEHGLMPAAVASRLTLYGAPESFQGAIAAGLLGVGDRFAGTASECARLLEPLAQAPEGKRAALARAVVRSYRGSERPIPGFGHLVHRRRDPRVGRLLEIVKSAGSQGNYARALAALETEVHKQLRARLVTNVSAAIAVALGEAGIPAPAVRGIVLTARCAGLTGHLLEEMDQPIAATMHAAISKVIRYER